MFNEGDSPGRMNAGFRSGPTDLNIPAVFSSYEVGKELYDAYTEGENPTVRLETSGETIPHFYPQVLAETRRAIRGTWCSRGRISTRSRPARASTTTAPARRGSSRSPSSSRSASSRPATRSASCGSAVRRTA